jgi:hypothetical protein
MSDAPRRALPIDRAWLTHGVEQRLVAAGQAWAEAFALGEHAPVRRRGDATCVSAEADQHGLLALALPDKLPQVELATLAPLCCPRIAEMRVMRPEFRESKAFDSKGCQLRLCVFKIFPTHIITPSFKHSH